MKVISRAHTVLLTGAALLLVQSGIAFAQEESRVSHEQVMFASPYTIRSGSVVTGPGLRESSKVVVSLPVSYADLDLGTAAGVEAFKGRVRDAARKVCHQIDMRYPDAAADSRACVDAAAVSALEKVRTIVAARTGTARLAALP